VVVGELWLCQTLSVEMQLHFKQNPSFVTLVLFDSSHCTIWLQYDTEPAEHCLPGGHMRPLFWVEWEESNFSSKNIICIFFLCAPLDFQAFLRHFVMRTIASSSNQRNDSKFNLCSVQTRFWVETEENPVHLKDFLLLTTAVTPDFQAFRRHCNSDQRNYSVLTPKMWAVVKVNEFMTDI
jgi:hypothetical protein